jgi:phosphate transport system protein
MPKHFDREIDLLKRSLLTVSAAVEEAVQKAVLALRRRDADLAQQVIDGDEEIDQMEVQVEEECLKGLALYQPVAHDLRFIVAALKVNDEIERIGDLACNIAKRAKRLSGLSAVEIPFDFDAMATRTVWMLKQALQSLVNRDSDLAHEVWAADIEVDAIHHEAQDNIRVALEGGGGNVEAYLHLLTVARFVERIADQTTNIAKDVIYMVEGDIVRHQGRRWRELREAGGKGQ